MEHVEISNLNIKNYRQFILLFRHPPLRPSTSSSVGCLLSILSLPFTQAFGCSFPLIQICCFIKFHNGWLEIGEGLLFCDKLVQMRETSRAEIRQTNLSLRLMPLDFHRQKACRARPDFEQWQKYHSMMNDEASSCACCARARNVFISAASSRGPMCVGFSWNLTWRTSKIPCNQNSISDSRAGALVIFRVCLMP